MLKHQEKTGFLNALMFCSSLTNLSLTLYFKLQEKETKEARVTVREPFSFFVQEVSVIVGIILYFDLHIVKLRSAVIFSCTFFSLQFVHNKRHKLC